jgi:hypothetical protein
MSCVYVDWLLATVNPWIRVVDCDPPPQVGCTSLETHCTRVERQIWPENGGWHCLENLSLHEGMKAVFY